MNPYIGDEKQLSGFYRFQYTEGRMTGLNALEVYNQTGLRFTVLVDRGLDISAASLNGKNLVFYSQSGYAAPSYFQNGGLEWLKIFGGGLMTTCGFQNAGPGEDSAEGLHGLHGRATSIPAIDLSTSRYMQDGDEVLEISGKVTEGVIFGSKLELFRKIKTFAQKNIITVEDVITNKSFEDSLIMLLYHCNFGYPLLSETAAVEFNADVSIPRDAEARKCSGGYKNILPPTQGFKEQVFFHSGVDNVTIRNNSMSVTVKWNKSELPQFTQWNNFAKGDYVMGIEPGNTNPIGRTAFENSDKAEYLKPGQSKNVTLSFEIN